MSQQLVPQQRSTVAPAVLPPSVVPAFAACRNIQATRILQFGDSDRKDATQNSPYFRDDAVERVVIRDQKVLALAKMDSARIEYRSREDRYEPQLVLRGKITAVINDDADRDFPYSVTELSLPPGQELSFSRIYRFTPDQISHLIVDKGFYSQHFSIPSKLTNTAWKIRMVMDGVFCAPATPDEPPLIFFDITDQHSVEMDMQSSGYDLVAEFPDVHYEDPEVVVARDHDVPVLDLSDEIDFGPLSSEPARDDYENRITRAVEKAVQERDRLSRELGVDVERRSQFEVILDELRAQRNEIERDMTLDDSLPPELRESYRARMSGLFAELTGSFDSATGKDIDDADLEASSKDNGSIVSPSASVVEIDSTSIAESIDHDVEEDAKSMQSLYPGAQGHRQFDHAPTPEFINAVEITPDTNFTPDLSRSGLMSTPLNQIDAPSTASTTSDSGDDTQVASSATTPADEAFVSTSTSFGEMTNYTSNENQRVDDPEDDSFINFDDDISKERELEELERQRRIEAQRREAEEQTHRRTAAYEAHKQHIEASETQGLSDAPDTQVNTMSEVKREDATVEATDDDELSRVKTPKVERYSRVRVERRSRFDDNVGPDF